jgi:hypothetical protein
MATYYRRNSGTIYWNSTNAWALTSGGASTGATPTSADDVIFDSNSDNNITSLVSAVCNNLTIQATYSGTIYSASDSLTIYASLTYSGGNLGCNLIFGGTASSCTINAPQSSTNALATVDIAKTATNRTISLLSDIKLDRLNLKSQLNTAGYRMVVNTLDASWTGAPGKVLTLGSSTVEVNNYLDFSSALLTINANTSTIKLFSAASTVNLGTTHTFYNFSLLDPASGAVYNLDHFGTTTINQLTVLSGSTLNISPNYSWNFNVLPVLDGTTGHLTTLASLYPGTQTTLQFPSAGTFNYLNITDTLVSPTQTVFNGIDGGNNSGWNFGNPITVAVQSLLNTAKYDTYNVTDGQTISQLKTAIQTATNVQTTWFDIVYNNRIVSESATLASLGIVSGSGLRTHNKISRLATFELRQKAKLDLSHLDRAARSNPRSNYDITELPTQYSGNNIVNNPNTGGLIKGRPWII